LRALGDVAIIYIISETYTKFELNIGEVTAIMLYVRTLMSNSSMVTNNIQEIAKVFGASYEIAVLIVSPNQVLYDGDVRPDPATTDEDKQEGNIKIEAVEFCYPAKQDVKVLKGI